MSVMNGSLPSSLSPCEDGVNIYAPLSNYIYHYNDRGEFSTKHYLDFGSNRPLANYINIKALKVPLRLI